MTIDAAVLWSIVSAIAALSGLALGTYNALTARSRREYDDLVDASTNHEKRLSSLERDVKHVPAPTEIAELRVAITELKGRMEVIAERVEPIKAIAERLQEAMLERGR